MGKHETHEMHRNSLAANDELERTPRERMILAVYGARPGVALTDRDVASALNFPDLNAVRPRITELIEQGALEEAGKAKDEKTGKTVRTVRIRKKVATGEQAKLFA